MKRIFLMSLSVLLILPVLLFPCHAAKADIRADYLGEVDGLTFFQYSESLTSGWYIFEVSFPSINYLLTSDPVFLNFVPSNFFGVDGLGASFIHSTQTMDGVIDVTFTFFSGDGIGMICFAPLLFDVAAYSGSYVFARSVDSRTLPGLAAVASAVISWVGQIVAVIVDRPLLLFTVGIFFLGGCIAIFSRFLSRD